VSVGSACAWGCPATSVELIRCYLVGPSLFLLFIALDLVYSSFNSVSTHPSLSRKSGIYILLFWCWMVFSFRDSPCWTWSCAYISTDTVHPSAGKLIDGGTWSSANRPGTVLFWSKVPISYDIQFRNTLHLQGKIKSSVPDPFLQQLLPSQSNSIQSAGYCLGRNFSVWAISEIYSIVSLAVCYQLSH
jgi:hypothetical protein